MKLVVYQDYLRVGGTERQSVALAEAAQERGHEVTLLTNRPGGRSAKGTKVRHVALQPFDSCIDEWAPGREAALRRLQPDVILCMGNVANRAIAELKKIGAGKVVGTARTGKRIAPALRRAYAAADCLISNSFALQSVLTAYGTRAPVQVVGNGLLVEPFRDEAARMLVRRKLGATGKTTVALCLQRFVPGKGQHYLMENFLCAADKADAQLWLVGQGPMEWPLKLYARALGDPRIKVLRQELPVGNYYNAADLAATASHEDSLPNFLIEAHAFGLPAVCEDYAGCGEVVVGGLTGFVCPVDDSTAFIGALQQLLAQADLRRFMGETARSISFRFNRAKLLDRFLQILEVVGGRQ